MNQQRIKVGAELTVWAVWLGALWLMAILIAPALFRWLPRMDAGLLAGRFFFLLSWYSLFSSVLLLVLSKLQSRSILLGVMAVCLIELFWFHPRMGEVRQAMASASADQLMEMKASFGRMHAISSALYAIKMIGVLAWGLIRYSIKTQPSPHD